jgi:hypothetical protein
MGLLQHPLVNQEHMQQPVNLHAWMQMLEILYPIQRNHRNNPVNKEHTNLNQDNLLVYFHNLEIMSINMGQLNKLLVMKEHINQVKID